MENANKGQANGRTMLKGLLIGSAVGAAAAMLMTPKSGKEMREVIRRKSSELSTAARERATEIAAQTKEKAGNVSVRVSELGRAAANKAASAAEHTAQVFQTLKRTEEGATLNGPANGTSIERDQP